MLISQHFGPSDRDYRCTFWFDRQQLDPQRDYQPAPGNWFHVHASPPSVLRIDSEALTMLQISSRVDKAERLKEGKVAHAPLPASIDSTPMTWSFIECPVGTQNHAHGVFDPRIPFLVPSDLNAASRRTPVGFFLQGLKDRHSFQVKSIREDQQIALSVQTYFVSPVTHQVCEVPREVKLEGPPATWTAQILRTWHDVLDPDAHVSLHNVNPPPPEEVAEGPKQLRIVIEQHCNPEQKAILLTFIEGNVHRHQATWTPFWINRKVTLVRANIWHRCTHDDLGIMCKVQFAGDDILDWPYFQVEHGNAVVIILTPRLCAPIASTGEISNSDWDRDGSPKAYGTLPAVLTPVDRACPSSECLQTVSLEQAIPAPQVISIPFDRVLFSRTQLLAVDLGPVRFLDEIIKWKDPTIDACQPMPRWGNEFPVALRFYSDGSAIDGAAATAVLLLVDTSHGAFYGGWRSFVIHEHPTAPFSESAAMTTALLWTAQVFAFYGHLLDHCPVHMHFDCLLAGKVPQGKWRISQHHQVAALNRSVVHWLESRHRIPFLWRHIPAHSGHPFNEAVDSIAWSVAHRWVSSPAIEDLMAHVTLNGTLCDTIPWLWMLEEIERGNPAFPSLVNGKLRIDVEAPFRSEPKPEIHDFVQWAQPKHSSDETPAREMCVRCVTANVLSLFDREDRHGSFIGSRHDSLAAQMHANQVHFAGLQETRSQLQGYSSNAFYHVLSQAADAKGNGGLQLWIAKTISDGSLTLSIDDDDIKVVRLNARFMIVQVHLHCTPVVLVVAHAPHHESQHDVEKWWSIFASEIARLYSHDVFVLIDANARLGSLQSLSVGTRDPEDENACGTAMHEMMEHCEFAAPQTFDRIHEGDSFTWCHTSGHKARIDYILCPRSCLHRCVRTRISPVDVSLQRIDHFALELDVNLNAHYESLAFQQAQTAADEGFPMLWRTIRALLPKNRKRRQHSLKGGGLDAQQLAQHFNQIEAGEVFSYERLLKECHRRQAETNLEAPLELTLGQLPTRLMLEDVTLRAKAHKAPGLDQISIDTVKSRMADCSGEFFALVLKAWTLSSEPLQWKGGLLKAINKRSGTLSLSSVRGIALLSSVGKVYHAIMRRMLLPTVSHMKLTTQYGGFGGQQPSFATAMLRSYTRSAAADGLSVAILYLDVRHAFHSMLRSHVFGQEDHMTETLRACLETEGHDVNALLAEAASHSHEFLQRADLALSRALQDAHCDTWFTMCDTTAADDKSCNRTYRGSRPGSPLADLACNQLMATLLQALQQISHSDPEIQRAASVLQMLPPTIAWVDDVALPMIGLTPTAIEPMLKRLVPRIRLLFQSYGLRLNFSRGKTEAIVQLRGHQAEAVRDKLLFENHSQLVIEEGTTLHLVSSYQHLGVAFSQSFSLQAELSARLQKASGAFRQLARPLLLNKRMKVAVRLQLFESLIMPIVMYGSGCWPLLSAVSYKKLNHAIVTWQRRIVGRGFWSDDLESDAMFYAQFRLPTLAHRLAKHRILFALQMAKHGPTALADCLSMEDTKCSSSWLEALRHALRWYVYEFPAHPLHGRDLSTSAIYEWLAAAPHSEANMVRQLLRRTVIQEATLLEVRRGYRSIIQMCQDSGVLLSDAPEETDPRPCDFPCPRCPKSFSSIQGVNAHLWRGHGIRSVERCYMPNTTCLACNVCYWNTRRLQQHLQRSRGQLNGCLEFLRKYYDPLPVEQIEAMDDVPDDLQHLERLPARPAYGPAYCPPHTVAERKFHQETMKLDEAWARHGFPHTLPEVTRVSLSMHFTRVTREWLQQHERSPPDDDSLMCSWLTVIDTPHVVENADLGNWAFMLWGRQHLFDIVTGLDGPDMIEYVDNQFLSLVQEFPMWDLLERYQALRVRADPAPLPVPDSHPDTRHSQLREPLPSVVATQNILMRPYTSRRILTGPQDAGIPLVCDSQGGLHMYVAHLYSGRRKIGDCHDEFQRLFPTLFPEITLHLLAIDMTISPTLCDMTKQAYEVLLSLAKKGILALVLSGPPCETWTAARHLQDLERPGPRPLRSSAQPWGIFGLTVAESKQLYNGSVLMVRSLQNEFAAFLTGAGTMMEHPATPFQEEYCSVWRTAFQIQYFQHLRDSRICAMQQWRFGSASVKPTFLRAVGLPRFSTFFLSQAKDCYERPTAQLGGWDYFKKEYLTAKAKEYPGPMCAAIAHTTLNSLRLRQIRAGEHIVKMECLTAAELSWATEVERLSSSVFAGQYGADYQRPA
eukprot:s1454_g1.t1